MPSLNRLTVWGYLLLFLLIGCGPEKEARIAVSKNLPEGKLTEVRLQGPLMNPDLRVNQVSIFEPVPGIDDLSQAEQAEQLYDFVKESIVVWNAPLGRELSTSLYGYGYALCSVESEILAALWHQRNIPGRLVSWSRHTVAEAKIGEQWKCFDAQHQLSFATPEGEPLDFDEVRRKGGFPPIDPVGYGAAYLTDLYREAEVKRKRVKARLVRPNLSLSATQSITLRKRESTSPFPLPISAQPDTRPRTHLVPLYELSIHHTFGSEPHTFDPGLPLIGLEFKPVEGTKFRVRGGPDLIDPSPDVANQALHNYTKGLTVSMPERSELVLTYALAAWIGDRIFAADPGSTLDLITIGEGGSLNLIESDATPRVWIKEFRGVGKQEQREMSLTLAWENLDPSQPLTFELHLEELSSSLPLELWRPIKIWHGSLSAEETTSHGSRVFLWTGPTDKGASPYRPAQFETYLAHLSGPHVVAGVYSLLELEFP